MSCCLGTHGKHAGKIGDNAATIKPLEVQHLEAKIARAMASGPIQVTKDATVAEWNHDGTYTTLREGTNDWICFPGNENEIGNVPLACDPMGFQFLQDYNAGKPAPTNKSVGMIYMLCGATQHSIESAFDKTSPAIPIGPHYMVLWPFSSKLTGIPNTARDAGAWVMFDGTPYAHLHVCGSPWEGNEYHRETSTATWTMKYNS
ncbi:hypothetical protein N431DRAFT_335027 [Stipitochalara longipes BDJ]|nr:hypothetical protein N431DRAFT_335027 [Stipitochalara longipes BDJ]